MYLLSGSSKERPLALFTNSGARAYSCTETESRSWAHTDEEERCTQSAGNEKLSRGALRGGAGGFAATGALLSVLAMECTQVCYFKIIWGQGLRARPAQPQCTCYLGT